MMIIKYCRIALKCIFKVQFVIFFFLSNSFVYIYKKALQCTQIILKLNLLENMNNSVLGKNA